MIQRRHLLVAKPSALRLVLVTALGAALVAACGGDGSSDTSGSGGADTGSGGNATGSGGTTDGSASGGASSGGSANSSGGSANPSGGNGSLGGDGGLGGDGPGPGGEDCPAAMPGPEDPCQGGFNSPTCTYGDQEYECRGFGPNATWECGEPGDEPTCPDEAPANDAPCTEQQFCNFGQGNICVCDGESWNCL